MLNAVAEYLPNPLDIPAPIGHDPEDETKELPEGLFRESIPRILQYFEETQGLNEATRLLLLIAFIDNLTDDDSFPPIKSALIKYLQNRT